MSDLMEKPLTPALCSASLFVRRIQVSRVEHIMSPFKALAKLKAATKRVPRGNRSKQEREACSNFVHVVTREYEHILNIHVYGFQSMNSVNTNTYELHAQHEEAPEGCVT